jgi:hypothetical protein
MRAALLSCLLLMATPSLPLWADAIPYPDSGTIAPTVALTAMSTGNVTGYFYGFSAADTDEVQMCDVTENYCSSYVFDNQTTAPGTSYVFDSFVTAGDVLVFNLDNLSNGYILSSNPSDSADGVNHAYVTPYSGTGGPAGIPAGTFVGMEDLTVPGSDLDYNDDQFVFTNVDPVPEPASLILLGTGLLVIGRAAQRKRKE